MNEIKQFFRDYPAFAWGGVVVVLLVAFYFANKINQNNSTAASSQNQIPTYILYDATQQSQAGTTGSTSTTGTGSGTTTSAKIRNKTPVDSSGGKETSVPIFATSNSQQSIFHIPFGQSVSITGPSVTGRTAKSKSGKFTSSTWYPVTYNGQSGFVVSYDLANPPSQTA